MADAVQKLTDLIAKAKRSMWGKSGLSSDMARNTYIAEYLVSHGVTEPEWISVKDRLPEKREDVLLCRKWWGEISNPKMGWYNEVSGKWFDLSNMEIHNVTHWMPLPQPPKGE